MKKSIISKFTRHTRKVPDKLASLLRKIINAGKPRSCGTGGEGGLSSKTLASFVNLWYKKKQHKMICHNDSVMKKGGMETASSIMRYLSKRNGRCQSGIPLSPMVIRRRMGSSMKIRLQ